MRGDADAAVGRLHRDAGLGQLVERGLQKLGARALEQHVAADGRNGHGEGAGLDAVGEHRVHGAFEAVGALDAQGGRADAFDLGAHLDEALGDVADLRLARGVLDDRLAAGQRGGEQHVVGGADGNLGEHDAAAAQIAALGLGEDVAGFDLDLGAELLQAHQMQIDRARADGAAAGQRNLRLSAAGKQRAEHPEAGAHAADHLVGRHGIDDVARREMERLADVLGGAGALAVDGEVDAVVAQDAGEQVDVGEIGNVLQRQPVRGQQAGNHQRQGGVLGAGDRNRTVEPLPADDLDAIHADFPSHRRCTGNFR